MKEGITGTHFYLLNGRVRIGSAEQFNADLPQAIILRTSGVNEHFAVLADKHVHLVIDGKPFQRICPVDGTTAKHASRPGSQVGPRGNPPSAPHTWRSSMGFPEESDVSWRP